MDTLLQNLRHSLRVLRKNPGFAAVAILTLGLGIGANTAIFSVVENVLLRPLPYRDPSSLVQIWNTYLPSFPQTPMSSGDFLDYQRDAKSFSQVAAYVDTQRGFNLTGEGQPERVETRLASSGLFSLLGIQPVAGRTFTPEEDKQGSAPVVLISHNFWQNHFGSDPSVVGRTLTLDGSGYTLVGVLPAQFRLSPSTDLWLPISEYPDDLTSHLHHEFNVLARLKRGVTVDQAQAEIVSLNRQELRDFPDTHKSWGVMLARMEDPSAIQMRLALLILFGVVGLVLLVACANIVNLLLARNATRQKEIALRIALGASRSRLLGQLLTESILLSFAGGMLGILLAAAGLRVLGSLVPTDLANIKASGLDGFVLIFTLAVSFLAGIVCGLIPAVQSLKQDLNGVLKEGTRTAGVSSGQRLRSLLVVSEIALALIPLVGAGLLIRSFHRLLDVSPGFQREHILALEVDQPQLSYAQQNQMTVEQSLAHDRSKSLQFDDMAQRISALPGVKAVGGVTVLPLESAMRSASRFAVEGQPLPADGARPIAETRSASPGYFAAMGIPLLMGRPLDPHDYSSQTIVINQAFAQRFWPGGDPIGKRINMCWYSTKPCWLTIVGVVGNVHQYGLDAAATLDVYYSEDWPTYTVIRTAIDPAAIARSAIAEIHKFDLTLPVTHVITLNSLFSDSVSPRRFSTLLLGIFAGLALVLAAMGIYGVMSYIVSLRTNEIGIRMALGARPGDIWRLVIGRGAKLALAGVALGLAGALALTKLISSLLYGVKPTDPVTFFGVASLLVGVALLACYIPAQRAMRVDPMVALRHE